MKIALITDTHCGARNDTEVFNNYFLRFFDEVFFPRLEEENINTIIHLGDVFDRRKYVNYKTINSWKQNIFSKIEEKNLQTHIILGNHDTYYKNTNRINSPTQLLREYSTIHIYDKATTLSFDDFEICFLPWVNDENYAHSMEEMENTKAEVLMGHLEIKGFEQIRGHVNYDDGFEQSQFKKFDMVLSGHYHCKSSGKNISYLGSPYEIYWNDWNADRGFHLFDTETRELDFVKNPLSIFEKIYYKDGGKTFESVDAADYSFLKNCYVKVVVEERTNPYLFEYYIDKIYQQNPADLTIVETYDELDPDGEGDVDEAKDTLTLLKEYIENISLHEDKKELIKLMKDLYQEAMDLEV